MYKLLFAEDESAAMQGILAGIDWPALGIGPVLTARNGMAAWETAQNDMPDILLTDIRMPRMNGIDLAHRICELNPQCSILILSGYSEPEYLRSAIKLRAVDFVDKTLRLEILAEQLRNAVAEQERNSRRIRRIQQNVSNVFTQKRNAAPRISELMREAGIQVLPEDNCCAFIIRLLPGADGVFGQNTGADEFYTEICRVLSDKHIPCSGAAVEDHTLRLQVYVSSGEDRDGFPNRVYGLLNGVWESQCAGYPLTLHVCASPVMPLREHRHASEQAELQLSDIFFHADERFHYSGVELEPKKLRDIAPTRFILQELEGYASAQNLPAARGTLSRLATELKLHWGITKSSVVHDYTHLLSICSYGKMWTKKTGEEIYLEFSECSTIEEANSCFLDFIASGSETAAARLSVTEEILAIIREQYVNCTLSLDDICRQIHRSPSYVCAVSGGHG